MNRALLNLQPWRLVLLTAGIAPLTVWSGARWGETGGAVTLAALIIPVACTALSGKLDWSLLAAFIAGTGIVWEANLGGGPDGGSGIRFATVSALSLLSMAVIVATTVRLLRQQLHRHREELKVTLSDEWDVLKPPVVSSPDSNALAAVEAGSEANHDDPRADFPLLLLTLQDIGRRVSMNLDLDTLIPAVISTAKASLDCDQCHVYLWDRKRQGLVNPLSERSRDAGAFVPSVKHGIGAWVIQQQQIFAKEDLDEDGGLLAMATDEPHIPAAVAPLMVGSDLLGMLVIDGLRTPSSHFVRMLYTLASIYALGIKNAQLFRRVEEMALRDGLTGLFNHATFQRKLRGLLRETLISEGRFSLIMSDADRFKQVNDTYGHQAGDEVLRELARLWKAAMPDNAILARYGGEEFIAALPNVDSQQAADLAEFLRESIAAHPFSHEGRELRVTASFGVAEFRGADQSIDDIVREADQSLFAAKNAGRNRVVSRSRRPIISLRKPS